MVLYFVFHFFAIFILINCNYDYELYVSDPTVDIMVFKYSISTRSYVKVDQLSTTDQIHHCNIRPKYGPFTFSKRELQFKVLTGFRDDFHIQTKRCLNLHDRWIMETNFQNCPSFSKPTTIVPIRYLENEELIFLVCSTSQQEYITELKITDYPRLQIQKFPSDLYRNLTKFKDHLYIPFGTTVKCVSTLRSGIEIKWTKAIRNSQPLYIQGQVLYLESGSFNPLWEKENNVYFCYCNFGQGTETITKISFTFRVQVKYLTTMTDESGVKNRHKYDTGETIFCQTVSSRTLANKDIWINPVISIHLTDIENGEILQKSTNVITIKPNIHTKKGNIVGFKCLIRTETFDLDLLKVEITLLTKEVTRSKFINRTTLQCLNPNHKIYLYINKFRYLPLSVLVRNSVPIVSDNTNKTVSIGDVNNYDPTQYYFVVCKLSTDVLLTPMDTNFGLYRSVEISMLWPRFADITKYQVKGFRIICETNNHKLVPQFVCKSCGKEVEQHVINKNDQSILEVVSNDDLTLQYNCDAYITNTKTIAITKSVDIDIIGDPILVIKYPGLFYYPETPVICQYINFDVNDFKWRSVPVPTRLMYTENDKEVKLDTPNNTLANNETLWNPRIPPKFLLEYATAPHTFRACCLLQDSIDISQCELNTKLDVIVSYSFVYTKDVANLPLYPGDSFRCCILRSNSEYPTKIIGNAKDNCLPAMMTLYTNELSSDKDFIINKGENVLIPPMYRDKDISTYDVYVFCSTGIQVRYHKDKFTSLVKLKIKSCTLNPPDLIMRPTDQTLFLVNETITCEPVFEECKYGMKFNFHVRRGGVQIDFLRQSSELVLNKGYVGNNIKITCSTRYSQHIKYKSRYISVHIEPQPIKIEGIHPILQIYHVITCNSYGFPTPTIMWTTIRGPSRLYVEDKYVIIRNFDHNGHYILKCSAFNIHGKQERIVDFEIVNVNIRSVTYSPTFYIVVLIELALYHILLIYVASYAYKDYLFKIGINA